MKTVFTNRAPEDLRALDQITQKQIMKKLRFYIQSKDPVFYAKKLVNNSVGEYRFRVGVYRIAFDTSNTEIVILRIRHRREIYR